MVAFYMSVSCGYIFIFQTLKIKKYCWISHDCRLDGSSKSWLLSFSTCKKNPTWAPEGTCRAIFWSTLWEFSSGNLVWMFSCGVTMGVWKFIKLSRRWRGVIEMKLRVSVTFDKEFQGLRQWKSPGYGMRKLWPLAVWHLAEHGWN